MIANTESAFKPASRSQKKPPEPEESPKSIFFPKKQPVVRGNPVGEARGSTDVGELEKILREILLKVREELQYTFMQVAHNDPTLTRLDLSNIQLSEPEIICLAKALEKNTTLELSKFSIDIAGMNTIVGGDTIRASQEAPINPVGEARGSTDVGKLEELKQLLSGVSEELKDTFMQVAYNNPTLTSLHLRATELSQSDITFLAKALQTNSSLTRVEFSVGGLKKILNKIRSNVREELKDTFMQVAYNNSTLTELDLSGKALSKLEIKCLAEVLKTNTTVTELNLSNNQLDTSLVECLMDALSENKTLTILNLSKCNINIQGMKVIQKKLKSGRPITIELGNNELSHLGESLKGIIAPNGGSLDTKERDMYNWLRRMIDQNVDEYITIGGVGLREAYRYKKAYRYEKQVYFITQKT